MMTLRTRKLVVLSMVFAVACLAIYLVRHDYFFKQSDQFYYLGLADSLRLTGTLRDLTYVTTPLPVSANSGAAFLMAPFAALGWDATAIVISILFLLLHLSTFFPLVRFLESFKVKRDQALLIVVVYFFSFPITMYGLWPINEGVSFALIAWFLYFFFARKNVPVSLALAFTAQAFRVHIVLVELAALVLAVRKKDKKTAALAASALAASLLGMLLLAKLFPYQHLISRFDSLAAFPWRSQGTDLMQAMAQLFIPPAVLQYVFKRYVAPLSALLGMLLLGFTVVAVVKSWKRKVFRDLNLVAAFLIVACLIYVALTPVVMARYFSVALFWILVIWILFLDRKVAKALAAGFVFMNCVFLVAYAAKGDREPNFEYLKSIQTLGANSPDSARYPEVYFDWSLPIHPRHVYAYFRRPSWWFDRKTLDGRDLKYAGHFLYLTADRRRLERALSKCKVAESSSGVLTLFKADCP